MKEFDPDQEPSAWGSYEDAEALRRWSFRRRTPTQRLQWLQSALELAYRSGAIQPRAPILQEVWDAMTPDSGTAD
jgi:hypothetical protein